MIKGGERGAAPPQKIIPIEVKELFKLTDHEGITAQDVSFPTVAMDTDDLICVRAKIAGAEQQSTKRSIIVVDVQNNKTLVKTNAHADSAIVNINKKWLGLKMGPGVQIFDLNKGASVNMIDFSEKKQFPQLWKWIGPKTVAIVTNTSLHHWEIDESNKTGDLKEIFTRDVEETPSSVISYNTDPSKEAHIIISYAFGENNNVKGTGQLHHNGKTSKVDAHAAAFCNFKSLESSNAASELLLFTSHRTTNLDAKLIIQSLTAKRPQTKTCPFKLQTPEDFPFMIEVVERVGCVFVLSKFGMIYLFDIESGTLIHKQKITSGQDSVFCGCKYRADPQRKMLEGVICITKAGAVVGVQIDFKLLMSNLMRSNQQVIALKIASRMNLPNAEDLYWSHFDSLKSKKKTKEAIELVAKSPNGILRTQRAIDGFQQLGGETLMEYLQYLENRGIDFNDIEAKHY
ncbi:hypothetical protein AKO1_008154 [Acrasis kona]|uniref:Clathrin heavy chain n=1 Tax=Acrasis kona TaxID=1008807 RepID=A0AAW2YMQ3_9EUKA